MQVHPRLVVDFGEDEDGGLALLDPLEQVLVVDVALGKRGQLLRELEQQLESLALLDGEELLADLVEGPAHDAGTSPGSRPFTIGTRTALPHSVQEPS